jgi:mono/diheme cytochrome c family protein
MPCLTAQTRYPSPDGQVTSVAFLHGEQHSVLAAFEREPAAVSLIDVRTGRGLARIDLQQASRFDTGHAVFHLRTRTGLACASCHAEAGDDAHVWTFEGVGPRRTQNLRGGLSGSEPLHWDGDMADFPAIVRAVLVGRMQGPELDAAQSGALLHFIDHQPVLAAPPHDVESAQRGRELFESAAVGCASCHTGPLLTNNATVNVGTGQALQVPALRGLSFRLPLMHDGCATTLLQRFEPLCGGGDQHGHTSQLSAAQLDDLSAYLETL